MRSNKDLEPELSKSSDIDGQYVPRTFAMNAEGQVIQNLNSNNSKWWYFLPANNAEYLGKFARAVKGYVF